MNTEYEVRILEIDPLAMERTLVTLGGVKQGEWLQKRYVYDLIQPQKGQWVRLRTNGEVTTLTYKNIIKNTVDGTQEVEIVVNDFERTHELLGCLGFQARGYQENKRTRYVLDGVEIDIDQWPMIPPYLEIEGENETVVWQALKRLSINKSQVTTLNCDDIYRQVYGIDLNQIKQLKFWRHLKKLCKNPWQGERDLV